jgi:lysophospholipase L1-like esterase
VYALGIIGLEARTARERKETIMLYTCHAAVRRNIWNISLSGIVICLFAGLAQAAMETVTPVPRDDSDWWVKRNAAVNARVAEGNADLIFIGDSITHSWENAGKKVWDMYYADRNAVNMGFSGDRTQHVLWRLDHGHLDGISPELAVVMIGTNNRMNTVEEIVTGVTAVVEKLRTKLPDTKILLLGIFPRADLAPEMNAKMPAANEALKKLDDGGMVQYLDIGQVFLEDGKLPESVMPDLLHPNEEGYWRWARAIEPKVAELLGEYTPENPPKGFVPLFNGEDLTGWKGLVADPEKRAAMSEKKLAAEQEKADKLMRDHWQARDGVLYYDGGGASLCTARDYRDFELLVDWKITDGGDSGLYLRGSPQVQIWDPKEHPEGSGGLFNNKKNPAKPLVCADNPVGDWNRFRIIMIDERVTVYLNDQLVVDDTVLENYWNRDIPIYRHGQIELQNHHSELWFRNVFIREIPEGEGWTRLFNGSDLSGWDVIGGDESSWGAEDGLLFTTGQGGGWLCTEEEYGDFELELEFRLPPGGNSGVFIRAPREGNPAFEGSEIQILDDYAEEYAELKDWQYCGSLYATAAPAKRVSLGSGVWQKHRIRCQGAKVQVFMNGVPIIDTDLRHHVDKREEHPGLKRKKGFIGLQNHGSRLDFRNIRLRELAPAP